MTLETRPPQQRGDVDVAQVAALFADRTRAQVRHHLGGRLGAALLTTLTSANWISRQHRQRAVQLTDTGARELRTRLGVILT